MPMRRSAASPGSTASSPSPAPRSASSRRAFADWHKTFWDNLATSIELHQIGKVIAIDHRDCGAAKIAYGEAAVADPARETETHRKALAQFREEVGKRHPNMAVETGLMALDGSVEMLG